MLNKFREIKLMMRASREQGISMRRKLSLYWLSTGIAVLAALLLVLSLLGVFSGSSRKLQSSLSLQHQNTCSAITDHMDALEAGCLSLSRQISGEITDLLSAGWRFGDLNDNPELISMLEGSLYPFLNTSLRSSRCSGVFVCLNATCNTSSPDAEHSRMGLYLRYSDLSGVNTANKHLVYFRGVPDVARAEKTQMHNRWNLEMDTRLIPGYEEMMGREVQRLADECFWSEKINLKGTWEDALLLFVPVLGNDGKIIGLCGAEISELYFRLSYPSAEGPFGSMLPALIPAQSSSMYLDRAMPGSYGDLALPSVGAVTVREGRYCNTYSTGRKDYLGLHSILPVRLGSGNELAVVTLMDESSYHCALKREQAVFSLGFAAVFLIMLALSGLLAKHFASPISELLSAVMEENTLEGKRSGISEIDELVECLQSRANEDKSSLPPKIEALLGSFAEKVRTLTPMERTVLQYYIEDCSIEEVAARAFISVNTAKKHNTNINHKLGVKSREELMLYIDLFRRCGKLNEISYKI